MSRCASCSATCSSAWRSKVRAETENVFSCLLCKMCEENCPAGVHIAENVRTLRHHIVRTTFGLGEG